MERIREVFTSARVASLVVGFFGVLTAMGVWDNWGVEMKAVASIEAFAIAVLLAARDVAIGGHEDDDDYDDDIKQREREREAET